jgi:hypothetical protein
MKIRLTLLFILFTALAAAQLPIKTLRLKNGSADITIDSAKVEAGKLYFWIHGLTDPVHAVGVDSTFADSAAIADSARASGMASIATEADTARASSFADSTMVADSARASGTASTAIEADTARASSFADSTGKVHISGIDFDVGINVFDTTAETDTVLIEGGTTGSIYFAWPTGDTITSSDILSMETIDGGFVVHRPSSGTSNLPYAYIKLK